MNVIANQPSAAQNPDIERRKIKTAIRRSIEDGWQKVQRLFEEANALKEQITGEYNARGTLHSGMHLAAQTKRVKSFNQDCDKVEQGVDRAIEDALMGEEQGWDAFSTADWLKDERELYSAFAGFIAERQNEVAQDGLELAKRFGDEALWTDLMKKE